MALLIFSFLKNFSKTGSQAFRYSWCVWIIDNELDLIETYDAEDDLEETDPDEKVSE